MRKPGKMTRQALSSAVRKPATVLYPFERLTPPPAMRGKIVGDANKCIGCKLCMRDCPSDAIHIIKTEKEYAKAIFQKNLRVADPEGLERAYLDYSAVFPEVPYPTADGVKTMLE